MVVATSLSSDILQLMRYGFKSHLYTKILNPQTSLKIVLTPYQESRFKTITVLAILTAASLVTYHKPKALGVEQRATHNSLFVEDLQ